MLYTLIKDKHYLKNKNFLNNQNYIISDLKEIEIQYKIIDKLLIKILLILLFINIILFIILAINSHFKEIRIEINIASVFFLFLYLFLFVFLLFVVGQFLNFVLKIVKYSDIKKGFFISLLNLKFRLVFMRKHKIYIKNIGEKGFITKFKKDIITLLK